MFLGVAVPPRGACAEILEGTWTDDVYSREVMWGGRAAVADDGTATPGDVAFGLSMSPVGYDVR